MANEPPPSPERVPATTREPQLRAPAEVEKLLSDAIKKSIDTVLQETGANLSAPREQALVERLSSELTIEVTRMGVYQGPLPPPEMLAEFEKIVPGLARRLVQMAENEQRHRHGWENRALWNDIFLQSGGLTLGWVLAGVGMVGAIVLGMYGNNVAAGIVVSLPVIRMIRSFINGGQADATASPQSFVPAKTPIK